MVNVLAQHQGEVSDHFASSKLSPSQQFQGRARFEGFGEDDPPALDGCLGYLLCNVVERAPLADHTLFVGEVERAELGAEGPPLIFCSRQYWSLGATVHTRT